MRPEELLSMTALELGKKIQAGEVTAVEAAQAALDHMDKVDGTIGAFVYTDREKTLDQAVKVQKDIERGTLTGPFAGVPYGVKDNICTRGMRTTCCSKILDGFVPPYSAEAEERMRKAGAVLLGKTNMDEFAMGSTTETSCYGPAKNP